LKNVPGDGKVEARYVRQGREDTFDWKPWLPVEIDKLETGRLVSPQLQLGITFAGYPLSFDTANVLGNTPLDIELAAGSYLLVLRKDGYVDTRVPVASKGSREVHEDVMLLRAEDVPDGFVFVPSGTVPTGRDAQAFQPYRWGTTDVESFFMARHEVTVAEWLDFLNHDEIRGRVDPEGMFEPVTAPVRKRLAAGTKLQVVRKNRRGLSLSRHPSTGRWYRPPDQTMQNDWPVMGISWLAAWEYAEWRNREAERRGERWRFRLPSGHEWERAARGVDRRQFVWGDYFVRSFCCSQGGTILGLPGAVGIYPDGESVFGVRDMVGSVSEHTDDHPTEVPRNRVYRGGSWSDIDEYYYRLATRNSMDPSQLSRAFGIRLVAELGSPAPTSK